MPAGPQSPGMKPKLTIGINYPWRQFGWDFGTPPRNWDDRWVDKNGDPVVPATSAPPKERPYQDYLDDFLDCFACLGTTPIRWILLGDALNYGRAVWKGDPHEWQVDNMWDLPPGYVDDFVALLRKVKYRKLQLLPVLTMQSMFWPGRAVAIFQRGKPLRTNTPFLRRGHAQHPRVHAEDPVAWIARLRQHRAHVKTAARAGTHKGGREEILHVARYRSEFLKHTLGKLLAAVKAARLGGAIFAWEVMSEPELASGPIYYENYPDVYDEEPDGFIRAQKGAKDPWRPKFSRDDIRRFIIEGAKLCANAGFDWTVGFEKHASMVGSIVRGAEWALFESDGDKAHLERYVPQFHYYGQPDPFPAAPRGFKRPVLLGEFPLDEPAADQDNPRWYDAPSTDKNRKPVVGLDWPIALIERSGYTMALGWSARGHEDSSGKSVRLRDKRSAWDPAIVASIAKNNVSGAAYPACEKTYADKRMVAPSAPLLPAIPNLAGRLMDLDEP